MIDTQRRLTTYAPSIMSDRRWSLQTGVTMASFNLRQLLRRPTAILYGNCVVALLNRTMSVGRPVRCCVLTAPVEHYIIHMHHHGLRSVLQIFFHMSCDVNDLIHNLCQWSSVGLLIVSDVIIWAYNHVAIVRLVMQLPSSRSRCIECWCWNWLKKRRFTVR